MKHFFTLTLLITCLLSCKKGDTGPQGPGGDANVNSQSFSVSSANWQYDNTLNEWSTNLSYSLITESVINNGAVQVYGTIDLANYTALPFTDYSNNQSTSFSYSIRQGAVSIFIDSNEDLSGTSPGDVTYKVVAIDGSARKMLKQKGISLRDYPAVKKGLNLKD